MRGTYTETWGENRLISQMDVGPAKIRRRTSAAPWQVSGELFLTIAELAVLQEFYENILLHGSLLFHWVYTPLNGLATRDLYLRFRTPPRWQRIADQAQVTLDLEAIP